MRFINSGILKEIIKNAPRQSLESFYLYDLKLNDMGVNLYVSKRRATKATHIHCTEGGDIVWEQFYPFGGMSRPARERRYALKPKCDKSSVTIVVIRGKPAIIKGLETNIFRSHLSAPETNNIYLMPERNISDFLELIFNG